MFTSHKVNRARPWKSPRLRKNRGVASYVVLLLTLTGCQTTEEADCVISNHAWTKRIDNHPGVVCSEVEFDWTHPRKGKTHKAHFTLPYYFIPANASPRHTVILFHGDPGGKEVWSQFMLGSKTTPSPITEHHSILSIDLPCHGQSEYSEIVSDADLVASIMSIALSTIASRHTLPGEIVVAGHSWGGEVALHLASSKELAVKRLILIDSVGFVRRNTEIQDSEWSTISCWWGWFVGGIIFDPRESDALAGLKELYAPTSRHKIDTHKVASLYRAYVNRSGNCWKSNYWASRNIAKRDIGRESDQAIIHVIGKVDIPTLLVWGAEDPAWTVQTQSEAFRLFLRKSKVAVIGECGHLPTEEKPEVLAALVHAWLTDTPLAASARAQLVPPSDEWK